MSPFNAVTLWLREGTPILDQYYIIGYWSWELERFPDIWHDAVELVDEMWTASQFTRVSCRDLLQNLLAILFPIKTPDRQTLQTRELIDSYPQQLEKPAGQLTQLGASFSVK